MPLKDDHSLESSDVVANCDMNRERRLTGRNSYERELGLDILVWLQERLAAQGRVSWLDLCCGQALALQQAAKVFQVQGCGDRAKLTGVDLVEHSASSVEYPQLRVVQASLTSWQPAERYDMITCVHGLHYIGDKLRLIGRAISWLVDDGCFLASLDLSNFKIAEADTGSRLITAALRNAGCEFDARKRILRCDQSGAPTFPFEYLGADDQAGPNSTGQPAVTSHYRKK